MNSRVNLDNQQAVILHQFNYRNSSLIVHFFIKNHGKISAVAKGVKGQTKANSASKKNQMVLFQPFQKLIVSLTGKTDLLILKNIELISDVTNQNWKLKGRALYCAYYINELLIRLLPSHTDCEEIFTNYYLVMDSLVQCSDNDDSSELYEIPLRIFELNLLEQLGYALNLVNEVSSGELISPGANYFYTMESGPSLINIPDIKQLTISGQTLINLEKRDLHDHKTLQESKQLLKWAINEHLGNKPLKSRELFKQLYC